MENKLEVSKYITCPHCGYQYLPSEILYPDNVIGKVKPESIIRDPLGKILYFEYREYSEPKSEESYTCDGCNKSFTVEVSTVYKIQKKSEELDFSELETTLF